LHKIARLINKEKYQKDLGKRIRELREKKGVSLKEFESLDDALDRSQLSKIETGQTSPNVYTLYRIAQVLGVEITDFFKFK
jgi:transcriptional regulator with XRE-family HTH domain